MEKLIANQIVIYENDAVLVSYTNGAGLQLAPCGTVFTYYHPFKEGDHPLHGQKKVLQRTCYVTSTFKSSVIEALDFRNRFACHPYLLKDLVAQEHLTKLKADVCEIAWPEKLQQANLQVQQDESVVVKSLCNLGKLTLASSRQVCTVQYFCRVSQVQEKLKWSAFKKGTEDVSKDDKPENRVDRMFKYCSKSANTDQESSRIQQSNSIGDGTSLNDAQWDYAWMTQHFSVHDCPQVWQHPLNLATEFIQKQRTVKFESDNDKEDTQNNTILGDSRNKNENVFEQLKQLNISLDSNKSNKDESQMASKHEISFKYFEHNSERETLTKCVFCTITKSLPQNCISSHLHKWGNKEFWDTEEKLAEAAFVNGRIKVICTYGIIYRFLWCQPKAIEIYPGDGTVLRSSGLSGHFFTHFIYNSHSGKVEEKMYSVTTPPPDRPGAAYSIARLLKTGERFLRHLYEESLIGDGTGHTEKYCCWRTQPQTHTVQQPLPNVLLEECVVPGVGKFTAYSSGRVRVVFADRTALDTYADFRKRLGHCKQHSDDAVNQMPDVHSYQPKSQNAHRIQNTELPIGICKLMLPNGHYTNVVMSRPDKYEKYIKAAREWSAWVNCSPDERYGFYADTLHDSDKVEEIGKELRKISCFNYILENTLLAEFDTKSAQRDMYLPSKQQMEKAALLDPSFMNNNSQLQTTTSSIQHEPDQSGSSGKYSSFNSSYQQKPQSVLNTFQSKHPQVRKMERESCNSSYFKLGGRGSNLASFSSDKSNGFNVGMFTGGGVNKTHDDSASVVDLNMTENTAFNLAMVEQILQKTSQAVSDLDQFLNTSSSVKSDANES